ncbi:MAG TPA: hypothetical protein VNV66_14305, partial [Pilimelia sp.]|nr:hypothetical protein [Pilimelia sp.]
YDRADAGALAREVRRVFDERYPAVGLPPLLVARRTDARGAELVDARDYRGAEQAWRDAARGYREAGDEPAAQVALGRLGALLCLTGRHEEGGPLLAASSQFLAAHGSPARRAGARLRTGMVLAASGDPAAALAALDEAAADAAEAAEPHLEADVLLRRAHCLAELERTEEFRAAAREALDRYRRLGGDRLPTAWLLYARAVHADGPDEALAALDAAVDAAPPGPASLEPRLARGRALCAAGRPADAVADFVEVVAVCTESDLAEGAAFARMELASAYHEAGRPLEAAEAGEEAVGALAALGAQEAADRCRYLLSASYRELGEHDAALALLDQVAANLDGFDNLPGRGQMHEEAGELLYGLDRDALAAARFHAAAEAYRAAGLPLAELRVLRRRALALRWAGDLDAALAALADADAAAVRLTVPPVPADPAEGAPADGTRADGTRAARRPAALRSIEAFGEAFLAELLLGEVLLRLDRPREAEPVLRSVLAGLPRDADPLPQAAWLLAEALARLGREEESAALRAEYGLDADEAI